ncbi:hypothetical protein PR202_ga13850 [Eleusine coracana subsp. coracana]|uniref:Uncharacterized protein n=1 Tax=Eleusine coracana subsp. coracana TaxID=191504 RepID=A0AAV5CFT3_ELECO|nr:hypothetical protein PR202_ga13850 [Eleusine coracana subsp. coracana]
MPSRRRMRRLLPHRLPPIRHAAATLLRYAQVRPSFPDPFGTAYISQYPLTALRAFPCSADARTLSTVLTLQRIWGAKNRRLLNAEKIIFKAESEDPVYVLVTVEPEGVVAMPNVPERELALFNIVCDELVLGIPRFAWWVGIGTILCIVLALLAPLVLPLHKLLDYEPTELSKTDTAKMS